MLAPGGEEVAALEWDVLAVAAEVVAVAAAEAVAAAIDHLAAVDPGTFALQCLPGTLLTS